MIGGHRRCRPCSTIVAPAGELGRAPCRSRPGRRPRRRNRPMRCTPRRASTVPSCAMRMNGVRTPRRVIELVDGVGREQVVEARRQSLGGDSSGCATPVARRRTRCGRHADAARERGPALRPALRRGHYAEPSAPPSWPSGLAPPSAVPSPSPAEPSAPPSWPPGFAPPSAVPSPARRIRRRRRRGRRVRAAVGDALAAGARLDGDVVVSDGHAVLLLDRRDPAPRPVFGQRNERAAGWRWVDSRPAPDARFRPRARDARQEDVGSIHRHRRLSRGARLP